MARPHLRKLEIVQDPPTELYIATALNIRKMVKLRLVTSIALPKFGAELL